MSALYRRSVALAIAAFTAAAPALAQDAAIPFHRAPMVGAPLSPKLATVREFKVRLRDSMALTSTLLEVGVVKHDVVSVADLSTGHLGNGQEDCQVTVAISRDIGNGTVRIERVTLVAGADQTIIDRRGDELVLAGQQRIRAKLPRIA